MGLFILFIITGLEIAFTVVSIRKQGTKGDWKKQRIFLDILELAALLIFMALPKISFHFRFKMCMFWMIFRLFFALLGWVLGKKKKEQKMKNISLIVRTVGCMAFLLVSLIPSFLFSGYDGLETSGSYSVKTGKAILIDEARKETFESDGSFREIPMYFYYPDIQQTDSSERNPEEGFPLVIFSHGAFGYYQSNSSTYMELASNGYVVVSLDHPYHSFFTKDTEGKTILVNPQFIEEVNAINQEAVPEEEIFAKSEQWIELRTNDVNAVLDAIKEAASNPDASKRWYVEKEEDRSYVLEALSLTNYDKIGLMGHSLGGATAVALGRSRSDISAVIDLDGTMLSERLSIKGDTYEYSKEPYPIPILSIDNEEHHELSQTMGSLYVNRYISEHAIDGMNTYFVGSGHMNFTDLPLFSPFLSKMLGIGSIDSESCIKQMNEIVLMYFNHYLKNEGEVVLKSCYR